MASNQAIVASTTPFSSPHGFEGVILDGAFYLLDEHSEKTATDQEKIDYYSTVIKINQTTAAPKTELNAIQPPATPRNNIPSALANLQFPSSPDIQTRARANNTATPLSGVLPPPFSPQLSSPPTSPQLSSPPTSPQLSSQLSSPSPSSPQLSNTNGAAPPIPPRRPGMVNRLATMKPGAFVAAPISPNSCHVPQIEATLPFQTYPLPPAPDVSNPVHEYDYRYSERYFHEEGVAAKKYWVQKYLDGGSGHSTYDRYSRDEICLPLRQTNMFHFNGDLISGAQIEEPSQVCTGFVIGQNSGHKIQNDDEQISMLFASNWGSDVYTSYALGHAIRHENHRNPIHYTIHGGNATITGTEDEVHNSFMGGRQNCCYHSLLLKREKEQSAKSKFMQAFKKEKQEKSTKEITVLQQDPMGRICQAFPSGKFGRFCLSGTHDNLFGGLGYINCLLKSNGIVTGPEQIEPIFPQSVSFFTLENKYWRVVALDSGYYAKLGHHHEDRLPQDLLRWLDTTVRLQDDTRGLIFMSHHNSSSRQQRHSFLLNAVQDIVGHNRTILWLAGDEHSTTIYQKSSAGSQVIHTNQMATGEATPIDKINSYTFVCGNSSLPMDPFLDKGQGHGALSVDHKNLVMYDARVAYQRNYKGIGQKFGFRVGHPGFMRLDFRGDTLTLSIKSLQLAPTQSMATFGHEFNVETPVEIANYVFKSNPKTGSVEKISGAMFKHPHMITSLIPTDYRFITQPAADAKQGQNGKVTTDVTINTEDELLPIRAGLRNLFLDSHLDWTHPRLPVTISEHFYQYLKHIGDVVGDPEARDHAREAAKLEALPRNESLLGSVQKSMRSSMRNLLGEEQQQAQPRRKTSTDALEAHLIRKKSVMNSPNPNNHPQPPTGPVSKDNITVVSGHPTLNQSQVHVNSNPHIPEQSQQEPNTNFFTTPHPFYADQYRVQHLQGQNTSTNSNPSANIAQPEGQTPPGPNND